MKKWKVILGILGLSSVVLSSGQPVTTPIIGGKPPKKETTTNAVKGNEKGNEKKNANDKSFLQDNSSYVDKEIDFYSKGIVASVTDTSAVVNIVPDKNMSVFVKYGKNKDNLDKVSESVNLKGGSIGEVKLSNLEKNSTYYYQINYKLESGESKSKNIESFPTAKSKGSTFSFGLQGDSHPERPQMFHPEVYAKTMDNVSAARPDFYFLMGDDFSIAKVPHTQEGIGSMYKYQREFISEIGKNSQMFFVNGNHESAAKYLLDGTPNSPSVIAQNWRNSLFSLPAPGKFFTGNLEKVDHIGYLKDYMSFTWGDALFVVIDPYWHSEKAVDSSLTGDKKERDLWDITLGDTQYKWFKETLEKSDAKYKFVITHHVLGTGRGGTDIADGFEWGGNSNSNSKNTKGKTATSKTSEFSVKRPNWEMPIHDLMVKNGVTIFFQGHDHIFVKQEKDGVIYQSLPLPGDYSGIMHNFDAYESKDKYVSSGFLNVTVSPSDVKVDYIATTTDKSMAHGKKNGESIFSYTVKK